MPELLSHEISRPKGFDGLTNRAFAALILERTRAVECDVAAECRRTGGHIVGRKAVLAQKWSDWPTTREPRRQLDPRVAARNKWSRIEALMRNQDFRAT